MPFRIRRYCHKPHELKLLLHIKRILRTHPQTYSKFSAPSFLGKSAREIEIQDRHRLSEVLGDNQRSSDNRNQTFLNVTSDRLRILVCG